MSHSKIKLTTLFTIGILFLGFFQVNAQKWEFGALAGGSFYFGDLNPRYNFLSPGGGMNLLLRHNFDGRICVKGTIGYNYLWADDKNAKTEFARARNLSFFSNTFDGSIQVEFNFDPFHSGTRQQTRDKKATFYLSTGLGIVFFKPKTTYEGIVYDLRALGTEGQAVGDEYRTVTPAWLIGGGAKFDINRNWSINIEVMGTLTFSDYLDDVSGTYAHPSIINGHHGQIAAILADRSLEVGDIAIGEAGRQRGDSKSKDAYMSARIGLVYRFLDINCPTY